ncbi:hypothetical protein [Pseudanabaena sp. FACHB-2040]|uniref:hypothetical protein n=1 Tax=Pseudanabaena sp. FACHB-2040 TaxID=2692859 RepID=UPI00168A133A|nr:hypothetical protein [Pseudanabaena sp. FACHB-2040]MBD2259342.1 hypothetical protein [Pseudanabaena sp. FACHB-2040]
MQEGYTFSEAAIASLSAYLTEHQYIDDDSLAVLMLFENTWATAFRNAVVKANGQLLFNERIPSNVINQVIAAQVVGGFY